MNGRMFLLVVLALGTGCAGSKVGVSLNTGATPGSKAKTLGSATPGSGDSRCDGTLAGREVSEYDTSGDNVPDIRKVFLHVGDASSTRLVLICRESDINSDGRKDVVRYYDDEGRTLREETDRNFDDKMDLISVYQDGKLVRQESDDNHDGKIDTKVFFDNGKPQRAERDLSGKSTDVNWKPDRWEYFEEGRMVRMGTDLDGDQKVDRWDRDLEFKRQQDAPAAAANMAASDG